MGKAPELELNIIVEETKEATSVEYTTSKKLTSSEPKNFWWWLCMVVYTVFAIFGQSATTVLSRLL
ncbi:hypothetical protein SLEP1_g6216 [Rubroshorea leprosula]|uniref:Uncharacterized protein n=1 Tax=Rubroshorea leprosula TaxID=152421 RepID=A0AAV5I0S4_9ROSI|nr:hypothetical protein SLEP1_g6216 [Rubroshorea leprosula]